VVLGWVQGAWCPTADLDRLFRLRALRRVNAAGSVRFRHWRLHAERGLAGQRAAVWGHGETLTVEHATETLARYRVVLEADGRGSSPPRVARRNRSWCRWRMPRGTPRADSSPTGRAAAATRLTRKRRSSRV
jgi:hypothetical protein